MGSKPRPFPWAIRTPSALSYLLKRMPEIDINDLGLGEGDNISPHANIISSPLGKRTSSHGKPLRGFACRRVFRKSKSPTKQAFDLPETRGDQKVRVTKSVSFHRLPKPKVSGVKDIKTTSASSRIAARRIALDSESVTELQKHFSYQGTKRTKTISELRNESISKEEDHHRPLHEATGKRRKLVRFIDEPEIIPPSFVAMHSVSSEEALHGPFHASINIFELLKR